MQRTYYDLAGLEVLRDKKPLLVAGSSFAAFNIEFPCEMLRFKDFQPNPLYEDIEVGVRMLKDNSCDFIVAVGGGSCIDTAKGIKYYSELNLPVMVIPTTAGSGSEATRYSIIYKEGKKLTITDDNLLPDYVILDAYFLTTLPLYQRKCTMLDALCQAIESWWSKSSTSESIKYSQEAISLILKNKDGYLRNEAEGNEMMLRGANLSGQAINVTTTTAPHTMCYKLTSLYNLPHGHAVALCLPKVWAQMGGFAEIAESLGQKTTKEGVTFLEDLFAELEITAPSTASIADLDILTEAVDTNRLANHPVWLDQDTIRELYRQILKL